LTESLMQGTEEEQAEKAEQVQKELKKLEEE
jgi:hypothetical protein